MPSTISKPLSQLIQKCWHQNPEERPACAGILQTLGTLSFPDNWKALLGSCTTTVQQQVCNGTTYANDIKLNVIAEDFGMHFGLQDDSEIPKSRNMEDDMTLDESDERPRAPIFSRSLSAPIPNPPPPPPMPKPHSMFIAPNILTPDPGKKSSFIEPANSFGFGITSEEIQRQRKLLKSRTRCSKAIYLRNL